MLLYTTLALLACKDKDGDTAADLPLEPLQDSQNYTFSSTIGGSAQVIGPGNATVDWSGLNPDLLGRTIDPAADVDEILMVRYDNRTLDDILGALNGDGLEQSWVTGYASYQNSGSTSAELAEFDFLNTIIDPDVEVYSGPTYLFNASDDDAVGYRGLGFFTVDDSSDNHSLTLTADSASIDYTVSLTSGERIRVSQQDSYTVDWTELETDGTGAEIRLADLDQLMLAWYEEDLSTLEGDFLLLEELAENLYTADISGQISYELYDMTDAQGAAFSGFSSEGTWVLALRCTILTSCPNPAPPFLGIIEFVE
jgi:hypothetical protein